MGSGLHILALAAYPETGPVCFSAWCLRRILSFVSLVKGYIFGSGVGVLGKFDSSHLDRVRSCR